ncbi:prefoldin, alpha subunit [Staphylothermus marinus F1]|uniref:Prefoldin subunit alpha n=1 Tax=Staphylothermus marinus (strain ATCC 43588 / DSM 3639 / JCM 9404 / F1) TaxID=399550 RepID=A3DNH7_STAMF|nr:prefoldin subunit alpha [Staphylothermus marinus]ABN70187.1 prefoldin, alpha subunit [Staphylothermus marinus F1]
MSKNIREKRTAVTLTELIARANELREYLNILQAQIETYTSQLSELQLVKNTLEELPINTFDGLVVLDRLNTAFIPIRISENWHNNVIVNIGRNYYVKTNKEKASKIVIDRISVIRRILNDLRKQYQAALMEYNTIQQILAKIYVQSQQSQQAPQQTGAS